MKKLLAIGVPILIASIFPISAMATESSEWKHHSTPITSPVEVDLEGTYSFSGGFSCPEVTAKATLNPGSTGTINSFVLTNTSKCTVIGGLAALGCTALTAHTPTELPWVIHNTKTDVTITNTVMHNTIKGGGLCASGISLTLTGNLTATPFKTNGTPSANTIETFKLDGTLKSSTGTNVTIDGDLTITPEGTYSL